MWFKNKKEKEIKKEIDKGIYTFNTLGVKGASWARITSASIFENTNSYFVFQLQIKIANAIIDSINKGEQIAHINLKSDEYKNINMYKLAKIAYKPLERMGYSTDVRSGIIGWENKGIYSYEVWGTIITITW